MPNSLHLHRKVPTQSFWLKLNMGVITRLVGQKVRCSSPNSSELIKWVQINAPTLHSTRPAFKSQMDSWFRILKNTHGEHLHLDHLMPFIKWWNFFTNLSSHDTLSFSDEGAFGAHAVLPAAVTFVALQGADHSMVAAPGAFGRPRVFIIAADHHCGGGRWLVGAVLTDSKVVHGTGTAGGVGHHIHHSDCWGGGTSWLEYTDSL